MMTKVTDEMVERGLRALHTDQSEFLDTQVEQMRNVLEAALTEPKVAAAKQAPSAAAGAAHKAEDAKSAQGAAKLALKPMGKK